MAYLSYGDWYDGGPGSCAFNRKMQHRENQYKVDRFNQHQRLLRLKGDIEELVKKAENGTTPSLDDLRCILERCNRAK